MQSAELNWTSLYRLLCQSADAMLHGNADILQAAWLHAGLNAMQVWHERITSLGD
jgi:hypothetical protein